MKSHIQLVSTKDMTREHWLAYRYNGIGASEVSAIMGLNRWESSISLFYKKLGQSVFDVQSLAAFLGKEREDFLSAMWEAYDPSVRDEQRIQQMISNYNAGVTVRRCKKVNAYAMNPEYPWLFVSLDREINKHNGKDNGALELKEISGYEADKWISGIPTGYVTQVETQIGVCEYPFGEIAILQDNRDFNVLPFDFNATIFESIVTRTKIFWDKVVEGRKIMTARFEAARTFNQRLMDECDAELQKLEPEADGSEAYTQFMKEKYKIAAPGEMAGTLEDIDTARKHKDVQGRIKELEEQKRLHENVLKNRLREGATKLDFGLSGYASWQADANGTRRFLNKVK